MTPLRIALLCHSTNPRGGVVHALEIADALHDLGHEVVVHAPDPSGKGFFRATRCRTASVAAAPAPADLAAMIRQRAAEYVTHFSQRGAERFDIWHAQDGISANALATLVERGVIEGFVRTVHHLDRFSDPEVAALQRRSVETAAQVFCVSRLWCDLIESEFGCRPALVSNGVDTVRYQPRPAPRDRALREWLGIVGNPVFLAVGGIEARKNTPRILQAFLEVRRDTPQAQLVIAGGASVLRHDAARLQFDAIARDAGVPCGAGQPIVVTGPLDDNDMPSLYRCADALVFPSLAEGFGLCVLEALASGIPPVVSRQQPFTEYLTADDVAWADPLHAGDIAGAMRRAVASGRQTGESARRCIAERHSWAASARTHAGLYAQHSTIREDLLHA